MLTNIICKKIVVSGLGPNNYCIPKHHRLGIVLLDWSGKTSSRPGFVGVCPTFLHAVQQESDVRLAVRLFCLQASIIGPATHDDIIYSSYYRNLMQTRHCLEVLARHYNHKFPLQCIHSVNSICGAS